MSFEKILARVAAKKEIEAEKECIPTADSDREKEALQQIEDEFKLIEISGMNIPSEKIQYMLELDEKKKSLSLNFYSFEQEFKRAEITFRSLLNSLDVETKKILLRFGFEEFSDILDLTPEKIVNFKFIENRDVNALEKYFESGVRTVIDKFKLMIEKIKENPQLNDAVSLESFLMEYNDDFFNYQSNDAIEYSQFLLPEKTELIELEKYPAETLQQILDNHNNEKQNRIDSITKKEL